VVHTVQSDRIISGGRPFKGRHTGVSAIGIFVLKDMPLCLSKGGP
jgi:hypothetical protein